MLFARDSDRYVIALFYGTEAQWVDNVLAAGGCRAKTRGRWVALGDPRRFRDPSRGELPWIVRPIARLLRVDEFLELRRR